MKEAAANIDNTLMDKIHELEERAYAAGKQGEPNPYSDFTVEKLCSDYKEKTGKLSSGAMKAIYTLMVAAITGAWNQGNDKRRASA